MNYYDYWLFRPIKKPEEQEKLKKPSSKIEVVERILSEEEEEELKHQSIWRTGT